MRRSSMKLDLFPKEATKEYEVDFRDLSRLGISVLESPTIRGTILASSHLAGGTPAANSQADERTSKVCSLARNRTER